MVETVQAKGNEGTGTELFVVDKIDGNPLPATKIVLGDANVNGGFVGENNPMPVLASELAEMIQAMEALRMAVQALTRTSMGLSFPDTSGRVRVRVEATDDHTSIGAIRANDVVPALMRSAASALRNNIQVS
jgi:hypothetical protein